MDDINDQHFVNPFSDTLASAPQALAGNELVSVEVKQKILRSLSLLTMEMEKELPSSLKSMDMTVYTGSAGIALCYFNMFHKRIAVNDCDSIEYLSTAVRIAEGSSSSLKGRRLSFLCGDAGVLACCALIYKHANRLDDAEECLNQLFALGPSVCNATDICDELLYGRAGYLQSLLFVQKHFGSNAVNSTLISSVIESIVNSGKQLASPVPGCPLMYKWHEKYYFGAAHGLAGIFYSIMRTTEFLENETLKSLLFKCLYCLLTLKFPSGNYLSSFGSNSDRLVQWCHGAPGFVYLFLLAYKIYDEQRFLHEALCCGDVVWSRGLLKKGYGICHGVAGNAYVFLELYKATKDVKHLNRALKFAEWIFDYGKHSCRTPDHPLSLFEGLAGVIYFLTDILSPLTSEFPGF